MITSIQEIVESDFPQLIDLFKEFAEFEKYPDKMVNTVDKMKDEKDFLNGFTVKDENGCIVGFVTFYFAYYTWIGKSLYMDDLYICPKYRSFGLGTSLINKVISFAKENKCNKLRWQVSSWNEKAIDFYKKVGANIDHVQMDCDLILD